MHGGRKTGASIIVEGGGSIEQLMVAGGWQSDVVARSYASQSNRTRRGIANVITRFATDTHFLIVLLQDWISSLSLLSKKNWISSRDDKEMGKTGRR